VGMAWTRKMHLWANSVDLDDTDPEAIRVANAFATSGYNVSTLVRELFSSPLITFAAPTQTTTKNGVTLSIARRDQLCAALSNRLGLPDVCGLTTTPPTAMQAAVAAPAVLIPVDTYYRAFALASLPTNPDLFFRQSVEAVCTLVAQQVIDAPTGPSKYSSTAADAAITDFVTTIMALPPSDPRAAQARAILADNFAASQLPSDMGPAASASEALQGTFVLACISPGSVLVGM